MTVTEHMRTAEIVEFNKPYRLSERAVPQCGDGDILIEVCAAGFCHSDVQVLHGQFPAQLPIIASHEPAGRIVEVGKCVEEQWRIGDRVGVLNFKTACGKCVGCRQHNRRNARPDPRFCAERQMAGFKHDGAFAQYMIADPSTTVHLPEAVSFEQGAPLMCAGATAWGALKKLSPEVSAGDPVAIVGIGGVGHLALQFAKALGYRTIAMDIRQAGRELAAEVPEILQPDLILDPHASNVEGAILDFTAGEGIAGAIVCTDNVQANAWILRQLGNKGVMVPLGLPKDDWNFEAEAIVFRELSIRGSYVASAEEVEEMLKIVAEHSIASYLTVLDFGQIPTIVDTYLHESMKGRLVVKISNTCA